MDKFEQPRAQMVKAQIARRGLTDPRLLAAFEQVPRHLFVPVEYWNAAYEDGPLPIGQEQTISQPYIVALMTDLLDLEGNECVLEVGTGSGYQAAILASMAREVHTIEYIPALSLRAGTVLEELGIENVHLHIGDGSLGWPKSAPYDAILVTAAAPKTPDHLLHQLKDGGKLVLPVGARGVQNLQVWEKSGNRFSNKDIMTVAFVPLRGVQGWDRKDW